MKNLIESEEIDLNIWIENILKIINNNKLPEENWKNFFLKIKQILRVSDYQTKLSALTALKKILLISKQTDVEIKSFCNQILEELIFLLSDDNVKISIKYFTNF